MQEIYFSWNFSLFWYWKSCNYSFSHRILWSLRVEMSLFTKQKWNHRLRECKVTGREWWRVGPIGSLGCPCTHCCIRMDNQQGTATQHRQLCSRSCNNWNGEIIRKGWTRVRAWTGPLCCTLEINTPLLVNYVPT